MFDVTFKNTTLLKKVVAALQDVLKEVQFDCSEDGMTSMGMDASHVALVNLKINSDLDAGVFSSYRCDKTCQLSFKVEVLQKVMKALPNDGTLQILVEDDAKDCQFICCEKDLERKTTFKINLLEIEAEHLGVPDSDYESEVQMPSAEFAKLMRDLSIHGESLQLNLDKNALAFCVKGDESSMDVEVHERTSRTERAIAAKFEEMESGENGVKDEAGTQIEGAEIEEKDGDVDMEEEGVSAQQIVDEAKNQKLAKVKKPKADKLEEKEGEDPNLSCVKFIVTQPVQAIYSLRYMNMFAKASPLGNHVNMSISEEQPIIVKFPLENENCGHLSFYLAPKIDE